MSKNAMKGRILVILSTCLMLVMCSLTYFLHRMTGYAMYFYIYITSLLCGGTSLLFIILKVRNKKPLRIKFLQGKFFQKKVFRKIPTIFRGACLVLYGLLVWYCTRSVIAFLQMKGTEGYPSVSNVVVFLLTFVILLVLDKFCEHSEENTSFVSAMLENSRMFLKLISFEALIASIVTVLESLKFFLVQNYVGYVFVVLLFYYMVCILLSMLVIGIRKDFSEDPYINVPLPSLGSHKKINSEGKRRIGFVEYLENNTGISMRSLWSVKFIRQILPYAILISGVFLWISTCVVHVESYQQAAVYRLGVLKKELLNPGFHLTLPYPIDKVKVYDTEVLNKMTIGYRAEVSMDNIWTTNHQGEEYKLLLGSGDEVVSINLRVEYKISNLKEYLRSSAKPESILEALSYELVTDRTIQTDLETLISTDREAFSDTFQTELSSQVKKRGIGLELVSVVLESIHPPKEIASVYQETISAGIEAQQIILQAEAEAVVKLMEARQMYDEGINIASGDNATALAEAKSNVAEFMASVEAYDSYGEEYTYQKYLNAVREAYGDANLVIISEDIDESALFFGNFSKEDNGSKSDNSSEE